MSRRRLLLVGASGAVGRCAAAALAPHFEMIPAGLEEALRLDLSDIASVRAALAQAGTLDAVVCCAGRARFAPLDTVAAAEGEESPYALGLRDKVMGQVNLALLCRGAVRPGGAIVLTSGTTEEEPIRGGSALALANGALRGWVRAAAAEWPDGVRLNLVSPSLVEGTPEAAMRAFPGWEVQPAARVGLAYLRAVESPLSGRVVVV